MSEGSTHNFAGQGATWETLEKWLRVKAQERPQEALEWEATEFLGRLKSQRRAGVDAPARYRKGHGEPRRLTLGSGTAGIRGRWTSPPTPARQFS